MIVGIRIVCQLKSENLNNVGNDSVNYTKYLLNKFKSYTYGMYTILIFFKPFVLYKWFPKVKSYAKY